MSRPAVVAAAVTAVVGVLAARVVAECIRTVLEAVELGIQDLS